MFCYKCGENIPDNEQVCPKCGASTQNNINDNQELVVTASVNSRQSDNHQIPRQSTIWMKVVAVLLIIVSIYCIYRGFNCKNEYSNSEYSNINVNAYVGGDAYNYIINGTYFAGYLALGRACGLASIMLLCTSSIVNSRNSFKELSNTQSHNIQ